MRLTWQSWLVIASLVNLSLAQDASNTTDLICRPFGSCEPCPEDALNEPFCQPFGNRRLMHCSPGRPSATSTTTTEDRPPSLPESDSGEIPAWEACGRIIEKERGDFYEFLACNIVIAAVALVVLFARSKRLQAMHARQLAARIGLVRGVPGGWATT
ncbi:hypothetical protein DAEQUDRAFT_744694 [Daedalea quercina L-15889]|uniref:Uncharacterized protein n=1 Tax=Daedalea quercina L-15889 TaxID=1314783 RepID=A0A165R8U4_9APHY|nr:hypothetical protein DAEQUDRAFT_744694 [Daedalea quercina L-15889]